METYCLRMHINTLHYPSQTFVSIINCHLPSASILEQLLTLLTGSLCHLLQDITSAVPTGLWGLMPNSGTTVRHVDPHREVLLEGWILSLSSQRHS